MGEPWDPSQPLRAGASDEQLYARVIYRWRMSELPWIPSAAAARELVAAETAALREDLARVTAERDALVPLARLAYGCWPRDAALERGIAVLAQLTEKGSA